MLSVEHYREVVAVRGKLGKACALDEKCGNKGYALARNLTYAPNSNCECFTTGLKSCYY